MKFPEDRKADMKAGAELLYVFCMDIASSGVYEGKKIWIEKLSYLSERLVDLKMGSLGRQIRLFIQDLEKEESEWVELLLEQIGIWFLCSLQLKRILTTEAIMQSDITWLIWAGWNISKDKLESLPVVEDSWIVMGVVKEKIEQLQSVRTWLYGEQSHRWAQHLEYLPPFQKTAFSWTVGKKYAGGMIFYPGEDNFRVMVKELKSESFASWPDVGQSLSNLVHVAAGNLTKKPFLLNFPVMLQSVYFKKSGSKVMITDNGGKFISLHPATTIKFDWLILSQNPNLGIFGEWESGGLRVLSVGYRGEFYN